MIQVKPEINDQMPLFDEEGRHFEGEHPAELDYKKLIIASVTSMGSISLMGRGVYDIANCVAHNGTSVITCYVNPPLALLSAGTFMGLGLFYCKYGRLPFTAGQK